ncbi:MAG TPA: hypothetical protein VHA09_00170 [Nitrososphaera sp.]|nr:hypothetical protein [Nitrososphaera sp.]
MEAYSEDPDFIVIVSRRSKVYKIPKSHVESFDGSQLSVDIPARDMAGYNL